MARKKLTKRVIMLVNDRVGLELLKFLEKDKQRIVALILDKDKRFYKEIIGATRTKNIFYSDKLREPKTLVKIKSLRPDLAVCTWCRYLLKKEFLDIFPERVINLHNAYLPYGRGKYPQVWAIIKGFPYGVTLHYMNERFDAGDIIARKRVKIKITDTGGTLMERALDELEALFKKTWPKIKEGTVKRVKQDEGKATYLYAEDAESENLLDLDKTYKARDLINWLRSRSFADRSYGYLIHKGKKIYVKIILSRKQHF